MRRELEVMLDANPNGLIPFYGAKDRALFEIERSAMDRDGVVTRYLDSVLPIGTVLDIGAGDGFAAARLSANGRTVVAFEPSHGMIEPSRNLPWARGLAQQLPFRDACFDGCYATFAYFFPSIGNGPEGLAEVDRVLRPGGPFVFVDSAGNDELNALRNPADVNRGIDISSPRDWWHARGFRSIVLPTSFKFETIGEARRLLGFFYGDIGRQHANLEVSFNAIAYFRRLGPPQE